MNRTTCVCGHLSFRLDNDMGHYRATGDNGVERTGPCRNCDCPNFRPAGVNPLRSLASAGDCRIPLSLHPSRPVSSMTRGACILDLSGYLLQDPWEEIHATFQVPRPPGKRPLRAETAQTIMNNMAGIPTKSLERMVREWDVHALAMDCVESARAAGITTVLTLDAPQVIVEALGHRLGVDLAAALTPEVVMGRLTGALIQPFWTGPCGDAVCLARVAQAALQDLGEPVWTVSSGRGCPCIHGRTVSAADFQEQVSTLA